MKKIILYITISAVLFSTMEVALKITASDLDSLQITFLRFLIGGLFLLPFAFREMKQKQTVLHKADYLQLLFLGILCICISMVFFQLGVERSNASTAAVIFSINPLFTIVFAHFITEEKLNARKAVALTFGLAGIVLMMRLWDIDPGNSGSGLAFSLISAVIFGLYSAMSKSGIRKRGGLTQTSLSFLLGSLTMLPILWIAGKPVISGIDAGNILLVLYIGIMVSGLGYLFYFLIMESADAGTASIVFFVKPALAPIIAVLVLEESMRISGVFGIMLILISSFINLKKPKGKVAR